MSTARGRANSAACQNNLHQLHLAATLFAGDNDDLLPHANGGDTGDGNYPEAQLWQQGDWDTVAAGLNALGYGASLSPYMGKNPNSPQYDYKVVNGTSLPKRISFCPGERGNNREYWPSYRMNRTITTTDGFGRTRQRLGKISAPSQFILLGDGFCGASESGYNATFSAIGWSDWTWNPDYWRTVPRHGGRDNFIFVDGHVESFPFNSQAKVIPMYWPTWPGF